MIKIFESSKHKNMRYIKLIGLMTLDDARFDDSYHEALVEEDRRIISIVDCSAVSEFKMAFVKYFAQSTKEYEDRFIEGHVFGLRGVHKALYKTFLTLSPNSNFPIYQSDTVSEINQRFQFDLYSDFDQLIRSNVSL